METNTVTSCLNVGHNFMPQSLFANGGAIMTEQVIFCAKCGETRKLEITPKAGK